MKKLMTVLSAAAVIALLIWALANVSTAMVRVLGFVDAVSDGGGTVFVDENMDVTPTLAPETPEFTDQDWDDVDIPADAPEDVRPLQTDYLTDGEELLPVDETADELAE